MKKAHRAFFVIALLAMLTSCAPFRVTERAPQKFKYYKGDYQLVTRKRVIKDYKTCKVHNKRFFTIINCSWGPGGYYTNRVPRKEPLDVNRYPNAIYRMVGSKPKEASRMQLYAYCPKCQHGHMKQIREYNIELKKNKSGVMIQGNSILNDGL